MKKIIIATLLLLVSCSPVQARQIFSASGVQETAVLATQTGEVISPTNPLSVSGSIISKGLIGSVTDRSGTIAVAGTSQTLAAANPTRTHFEIQAATTNAAVVCFNFTSAASDIANVRCLAAGATYNMDSPNFVSTELITVWSGTVSQRWSAKEF